MIAIDITATLQSFTHMGKRSTGAYFLESLGYIPGRALLGAAAWAWIDRGGDPDAHPEDFAARFTSGQTRWGDLLPTNKDDDETAPLWPPRTLKVCKLFREKHGYRDTLLHGCDQCDRLISDDESCGIGMERVEDPIVWDGKQPRPARLKRAHRTHLAIGAITGTARSGYLYSREALQSNQLLRGQVHCTSAELADELIAELREGGLAVGIGKSRGYGQVHIDAKQAVMPTPDPGLLTQRSQHIQDQVKGPSGAFFFILTAASGWVLRKLDGSYARSLSLAHLGGALQLDPGKLKILPRSEVRVEPRSGWDGKTGMPVEVRNVILPGSTFLCQVDGAPEEIAAMPERLIRLAADGLGAHRVEGLGRVHVNHDVHFQVGG